MVSRLGQYTQQFIFIYLLICVFSLSLSAVCQTQELENARQALYHGATAPTQTVVL